MGQGLSADQYINKVKDTVSLVYFIQNPSHWKFGTAFIVITFTSLSEWAWTAFFFLVSVQTILKVCIWIRICYNIASDYSFFYDFFFFWLWDLSGIKQGLNLYPLPWKVKSQPLDCQENPQTDSFYSCQTAVTLHGRVRFPALSESNSYPYKVLDGSSWPARVASLLHPLPLPSPHPLSFSHPGPGCYSDTSGSFLAASA